MTDLNRRLRLAVMDDDPKAIEKLINLGADVHHVDELGRDCSHIAVMEGKFEAFAFLMDIVKHPTPDSHVGNFDRNWGDELLLRDEDD